MWLTKVAGTRDLQLSLIGATDSLVVKNWFSSTAATTYTAQYQAVALAAMSWLAFGTESWQAFFHWMPMFSQAFLTEGRAPWGKMQSIFALVRYFGGTEQLAWAFQFVLTASVAVVLALMWRSRVRYTLIDGHLAFDGTLG